jgi:predicted Zn-dependent peptidase
VRERRGLAYYVRAMSGNYIDTGVFSVSSGVQVKKIEDAIIVILKELKKIKNSLVDEKELHKAKEYIKGKSILALEDNQTRLDWFLEQAAFYNRMTTPQKFFDRIDKIKSSDVQKIARDLFQNKNMSLSVIGPYKSDKAFKKVLKV